MTTVDVAQRPQRRRRGHVRRLPGPGEGAVRRRARSATAATCRRVNSINWARVMAQIVYYVVGAARLGGGARARWRSRCPPATSATCSPATAPSAWACRSASSSSARTATTSSPGSSTTGTMTIGEVAPDAQPEHGHPGVEQLRAPAVRAVRPRRRRRRRADGAVPGRGRASTVDAERLGLLREQWSARPASTTTRTSAIIAELHERTGMLVDPHTAVGLGRRPRRAGATRRARWSCWPRPTRPSSPTPSRRPPASPAAAARTWPTCSSGPSATTRSSPTTSRRSTPCARRRHPTARRPPTGRDRRAPSWASMLGMKYVVCVPDGCADEPVDELGGRTPARGGVACPTLDALAARAEVGRAAVIPDGLPPGSDVGNMSIFGYDPARYHTGRAPDRGRRPRAAAAPRPGRLPLQPGHRRRRRHHGRLRRRPPDHRGRRRGHRGARRRARAATASSSTPACSTATSWSAPADWADADCAPPHDLTDKPAVLAHRPGRRRAAADSWTRRATSSADFGLDGQPDLAVGPGLPAADAAFAERLRPRRRPRHRRRPGPRASACSPTSRSSRSRAATGWYDTDYEGKRDAALDALADGADLFIIHVEATDEAGHAGDVEEKVQALENWDRRILAGLVDGPRRARAVAAAAAARPRHAAAPQDPHPRPGALPAGRLAGRRPRRHLHRGRRRRRRRSSPATS